MTRDDGFAVMDVSTDFVNDPKWRKLYRQSPALLPAAFLAYTAAMCESWKAGRRVTVEEAWPVFLVHDAEVVAALASVGFIDRKGYIVARSWEGWFMPAFRRREAAREAGREGNAKRWGRDREAIGSRSGAGPRTVPSVPTDPSVPIRPPSARETDALNERGRTTTPEHIGSILGRMDRH